MRTLILVLLLPVCAGAQSYSVNAIPDSLQKGARAVLRESEVVIEVKSPGKAIVKEHQVYTVLDANGDNLGGYSSWYDKFNPIDEISGTLYDGQGKQLKRAKRKDMDDRSYVDESSLAEDTRYLLHDFHYRNYPYTVDYQEQDQYNGIMRFHDWLPLVTSGVSTQHSKYVIIAPKDYEVRWLALNGAASPVITTDGDRKVYTWEARNLPARWGESSGPRWREFMPYLLTGPSDFEVAGYKGNMTTWASYGKFVRQLREGRESLPDDVRRQVHALTDTVKDNRQKVYILYRYLQQNTHYINLSLGIGGWQPFPPDYVATKKYGDCKALSNYMVALLKEAGIPARYTVIRGGDDAAPIVEGFPSFQFNHIVTCVPMGKDSIWLECTSQTVPAGYMGSFTGGRKGLIIDDDGGHLVPTPVYTAKDNTRTRVVSARIGVDGNLDADVNTLYGCVRQEMPHHMIREMAADKNHYEELEGPRPSVTEQLHVLAPGYASVSGKRLFITPNVFDRSNTRLPADSVRHYDYVTDESFTDVDSVQISVPAGYQPEAVPKDVAIDSKFGSYRCTVRVNNDKLVYYRYLQQDARRFPPADYAALVNFYEQLYKADNSRIVLVKKE
jgi:transglutaminase-like putative cysteine protease